MIAEIVRSKANVANGAKTRLEWCANRSNLFVVNATTTESEGSTTIALKGAAIFLNNISLKRIIDKVPSGKRVIVDMSEVRLVDHSVMEHLHEAEKDFKKAGRVCRVVGLERH